MDDKLYHNKQSITLSIENNDGKLILKNGEGQEWYFSNNIGSTSAMATLVYSSILHWNDHAEEICSRFRITLEIQELIE